MEDLQYLEHKFQRKEYDIIEITSQKSIIEIKFMERKRNHVHLGSTQV